jgi:hypothetical protein
MNNIYINITIFTLLLDYVSNGSNPAKRLMLQIFSFIIIIGYIVKYIIKDSELSWVSMLDNEGVRVEINDDILFSVMIFVLGWFLGGILIKKINQLNIKECFQESRYKLKNNYLTLVNNRDLKIALCVSVFLLIVVQYIRVSFSYGIMGDENRAGMLGSIIFRMQSHLLPLIMAFGLTYGLIKKNKMIIIIASLGLLIRYAGGVTTGSKSGIIIAVFWFHSIYYLLNGKTARGMWISLPFIILLIILFYVLGLFMRSNLLVNDIYNIFDFINDIPIEEILVYSKAILQRVIGIDGIVVALDAIQNKQIDTLKMFDREAPWYYTNYIYGLNIANDFRAPGVVGFALIAVQSITGVFFISLIYRIVWEAILESAFLFNRTVIPTTALMLLAFLGSTMDGFFAWHEIFTCYLSALIVEFIFKFRLR